MRNTGRRHSSWCPKRYIGIEDTNSYIQQIAQYLTGALSAEELIRALDTTVAMMVPGEWRLGFSFKKGEMHMIVDKL